MAGCVTNAHSNGLRGLHKATCYSTNKSTTVFARDSVTGVHIQHAPTCQWSQSCMIGHSYRTASPLFGHQGCRSMKCIIHLYLHRYYSYPAPLLCLCNVYQPLINISVITHLSWIPSSKPVSYSLPLSASHYVISQLWECIAVHVLTLPVAIIMQLCTCMHVHAELRGWLTDASCHTRHPTTHTTLDEVYCELPGEKLQRLGFLGVAAYLSHRDAG